MGCVRSKPKSSHSCRSCGLRKFPSLTHVPKISFQEASINPSRDIFSVAHKMSFLGTIHILRKHSYSTKLNLTTLFFTNTVFFSSKQNNFFFHITFWQDFMLNVIGMSSEKLLDVCLIFWNITEHSFWSFFNIQNWQARQLLENKQIQWRI